MYLNNNIKQIFTSNTMTITRHIKTWWNDFLNLFFPNICQACGNYLFQQEEVICTRCLFDMPKTNFHLEKNNPVSMLFWGRIKIEYATAFFTFSKGSRFQKLIHKLKYKKQKQIGIELGKQLGLQLNKSEFFNDIDFIVPVPLHLKKRRIRGYNQSELIAEGVASATGKSTEFTNLYRAVHSDSQTKKNKLERWENVNNIFQLKDTTLFANKHILLVDDVVTTGSTLEACTQALLQSENCRVSVAVLAYA